MDGDSITGEGIAAEWHGFATLHIGWELKFGDALASIESIGVNARMVSTTDQKLVGDLLVAAYPAAAHHDPLVLQHVAAVQLRQGLSPAARLWIVACGHSDTDVTLSDVHHLACSDGTIERRQASRLATPDELYNEVGGLVIAIARVKNVRWTGGAVGRPYSPDALIEREAEPPTVWMGRY